MWKRYTVEMRFVTALCASVPANPEIQLPWLQARLARKKVVPANARSLDEIATEVLTSTEGVQNPEEEQEQSLHVFQRVEGALAMRAATVRAHIKDCGRVISSLVSGKVTGEKSFSTKVINSVYLDPAVYWLPILSADSGKPITDPTGRREKPIHVRTPLGERSAIKVYEYVEDAMLRVPLLVLENKGGKTVISESDLGTLFEYGGVHGYGGERGDGEGRYLATLTEVK